MHAFTQIHIHKKIRTTSYIYTIVPYSMYRLNAGRIGSCIYIQEDIGDEIDIKGDWGNMCVKQTSVIARMYNAIGVKVDKRRWRGGGRGGPLPNRF